MRNLMSKLWNDDVGAIIAGEFVLVATILVLGLVVGFKAVNSALNDELGETADAFGAISQSYRYCGASSGCARWNGAEYRDEVTKTGVVPCSPEFDRDSNSLRCGEREPQL